MSWSFIWRITLCVPPSPKQVNNIAPPSFMVVSIWKKKIQIKSNQILFKVDNVHLKDKTINKKLFTWLYTITNNNKLYIWFKYFGTSLWNRTWPSNENNSAKEVEFFIWFGKSFHIFAPLYRNLYSQLPSSTWPSTRNCSQLRSSVR